MNDAQRYRVNAAECLSAAQRRELPHRGLTRALAASWLSPARQQEAVDELLVNSSEDLHSIKPTAISYRSAAPVTGQGYLMSGIGIALAVVGCALSVVTLLAFVGLLSVGLGWAERADSAATNEDGPAKGIDFGRKSRRRFINDRSERLVDVRRACNSRIRDRCRLTLEAASVGIRACRPDSRFGLTPESSDRGGTARVGAGSITAPGVAAGKDFLS
jgi:hypothetical protein